MAKAAAVQQQPEVPIQEQLAEAETKIFGKTILRDATGAPMERGHGSSFQKLRHADRSHYLTLAATAAAEKAKDHAAQLSTAAADMIKLQKDALATAEKAAEEAAIAEVNAVAAADEIRVLKQTVDRLKAENLMLTAELAKVKKA